MAAEVAASVPKMLFVDPQHRLCVSLCQNVWGKSITCLGEHSICVMHF